MQTHVKQIANQWHGVLVAPIIALFVILSRSLGWMQPLELATLDLFFKLRPPAITDERIAIVGITERDIENLRGWPTNDWILARAIEKIKSQQPQVIGLDIYRNRSIPPGRQKLEQIFRSTPNSIGVEKVIAPSIPPVPTLKSLNQSSSSDVVLDSDGVLRRAILFPIPGKNIQSLGLAVALIYLQSQKVSPQMAEDGSLSLGAASFQPFESGDGGYINADAGGYQILLDFRGTSFKTVSLTDVLHDRVPKTLFRDRIVLIGNVAPSSNDAFLTPYSRGGRPPILVSGVEIQANLASQVIDTALGRRPIMRVWNDTAESLGILVSSAIVGVLSWLYRANSSTVRFFVATSAITATATAVVAFGGYALFLSGWWIPVVPFILAAIGTAFCLMIYIPVSNLHKAITESAVLRSRLESTQSLLEAKTAQNNSLQERSQTPSLENPVPSQLEESRQRLKERYKRDRQR